MATPAATTPPKQHPGERLANFFDNFFKTITAIATFGSSLTFSKVVSAPVTPWVDHGIPANTIQTYLSISWLLFLLDLGLVSFFAAGLSLWRPSAISWFGTEDSRKRRVVMWYATGVSVVLFGLLVTAFVFLGLVVAAYTGPVGWTAVAFTGVAGVAGFGIIVWQSPVGSKSIEGPPNEDLFGKGSESEKGVHGHSTDEKTYPGRSTDEERYGNAFGGGDGYGYEKGGMGVKDRYLDDRIGRRNTIERPPRFADTPGYTTDLRRMRQIRASDKYAHDGRQ
ncbi:uncharacterized protein PAC_17590 [Phialocephala subalpina]|uniref:Uncharacterized protein n=1 Tax=Phialocephala subalpina TaxID=576137 RepID=A0A1L7XRJ7_9HELO|nr:uncharacterized protein PAC_17590 [Phialocephala subalpina]